MLPDGSDLVAEEMNDCSLLGIWMGWNSPTMIDPLQRRGKQILSNVI